MLRIAIVLLLFIIAAACTPKIPPAQPEECTPCVSEDIPKPKVALISLIDSSCYYVPWYLDEELSDTLRYQLMENGKVFLPPEGDLTSISPNMSSQDYFGADLEFSRQFQQTDYLVAMELIEHAVVPFEREKVTACFPAETYRCCSMLQMKMRLRVIALKNDCPKVILQEIFTNNSMIPNESERIDYERLRWGTPGFQSTPLAQAHRRLIRDLACRIESAIEGLD